ncbi:MAG: outer membrane beta-barrel protein [Sulfurimonas sp.]
MKKIILFSLLITSLYSDAKIYIGANIGGYLEQLDSGSTSATTQMISLKAGYGDIKAYAVEFSVDYINNKTDLFAQGDGVKYGMNVSLLKSFDFDLFFIPFVKAGFGAGKMDSNAKTNKNSLAYGSFNLGIGSFIPLSDSFDLEVGYDYRAVTYEKADSALSSISKSNVNLLYAGFNYRF